MTPPKPPKKRYTQETMMRPPSPTPVLLPTTNNNSSFANNNNGDCATDGLSLNKSVKYGHTSPAPSSSAQHAASLPISEVAATMCLPPPSANSSCSRASPHHPSTMQSSDNGGPMGHTISRIMSSDTSHRSCPAPPEMANPHHPGPPNRYSPTLGTPGVANRYSPPQEVLTAGHQRSYSLPPSVQMAAPQNQPLSLTLSPKNASSSSPPLPPHASLLPSSSYSSQNQQVLSSVARNQDPNSMAYVDERERSQLDRRRSDGLVERMAPKKNNCLKRRIIEQETQRTSAQALLQDQPLNLKMGAQQAQAAPTMNDRVYHRKKLCNQRRSSLVQSPAQPSLPPRQLVGGEAGSYPSAASGCTSYTPPRSPYSSGTPPHPSPAASPAAMDYTNAQGTNHVQTGPVKTVTNSGVRHPNASSSPDIVQITKVNASDGRNSKRNNVPSPKAYSKSKQSKQSLHPSGSDHHANTIPGDRVNAFGGESTASVSGKGSSSHGITPGSTVTKNSSLPPKKSPHSPARGSPPSTASPASSPTPTDKQQEQMLIDCIIVEGIKRNTIDTEKEERNFQLFCRSQRGAEVGVMLGSNGTPGKMNSRPLFSAANTPTVNTGPTSCSSASAVAATTGAATAAGGSSVTGPSSALYSKRTSSSPSASRDA